MVVDVYCAVVEAGQDPRLCRMEVYTFYAVGPGEKFPLLEAESSAGEKGDDNLEHTR